MSESEGGFRVTTRDVYNEVVALREVLREYMTGQAPVIAVLQRDRDDMRDDIRRLQEAQVAEHRDNKITRWSAYVAIAAAVLGAVLAFVFSHIH